MQHQAMMRTAARTAVGSAHAGPAKRRIRTFATVLVGAMIGTSAFAAPADAQSAQQRYLERKAAANDSTVTIIGGGISGTYLTFAEDIANVLDNAPENDIRVIPMIGRGGGANVLDILFLKGVDMGITQQEHLEHFRAEDPALFGGITSQVHYITKLYNSEFHMVAKTNIKSLADLDGKKVNCWKENSATDISCRTIFRLLDIKPEIINIDTPLGIEQVRNGEIAATTLLAGAPIGGFKPLKASDGLHFVPVDAASLPGKDFARLLEVYLPTQVSSEQYPEMIPAGRTVETLASGAVLAVYNWSTDSERYRRVARFVKHFFDNFESFRKPPRHEKWKEINLAATIPGWTRFRAAQEWLDENAQKTTATNNAAQAKTAQAAMLPTDVEKAFESFLLTYSKSSGKSGISKQQRRELFASFKTWWAEKQGQSTQ